MKYLNKTRVRTPGGKRVNPFAIIIYAMLLGFGAWIGAHAISSIFKYFGWA